LIDAAKQHFDTGDLNALNDDQIGTLYSMVSDSKI
jgi:hypothetical protein